MHHVLIDEEKVEAFSELYGKPDEIRQHGDQKVLYYEDIPEGLIEQKGGGWCEITLTTQLQGRAEAFLKVGELYNLLPDFEFEVEEGEEEDDS